MSADLDVLEKIADGCEMNHDFVSEKSIRTAIHEIKRYRRLHDRPILREQYQQALIAARAEVLRLERLGYAEICTEIGHLWCDAGDVEGANEPTALFRCARCDDERREPINPE